MLGELGLDAFSERVYRAVALHSHSGIDELTEWVGARHAQVAAAVRILAARNLIREVSSDRWMAQDPVQVLAAEQARYEAKLTAERARMAAARAALYDTELFRAFMAGRRRAPAADQEIVGGGTEVWSAITDLMQRAERSVLWMTSGTTPPAARSAIHAQLLRARDGGLWVRGALTADALAEMRRVSPGGVVTGLGDIRQTNAVPMRTVVVDRSIALVPIHAEDLTQGALVLRTPTLVTAVTAMVSHVYDQARPVNDDDDAASETERRKRAVLELLSTGLTEKIIAERLGKHVRTITRDIEQMCDELGVSGRFGLGAAAAQQGLLPRVGSRSRVMRPITEGDLPGRAYSE